MTKKFLFVFAILLLSSTAYISAQDDTYSTPVVEDEMTIDPEQNKQWRMGQYKYSAQPKNAFEVGVHFGHALISGDVEYIMPAGFGVGLHLRKALNYNFSVRAEGFYSVVKGYDARPQGIDVLKVERVYLQQNDILSPEYNSGAQSRFHRNYKTNIIGGMITVMYNVGNLLFHQERNKWNVNVGMGMGLYGFSTYNDLLDENNAIYDWDSVSAGLDLTKREDRKESRDRLKEMLDGDYETSGGIEDNVQVTIGDAKTILPSFYADFGVARKITKRFNIGLEYRVGLSDNDLLDGFEYRTKLDETNNEDLYHYINVRLNFNLANFNNRLEPLYWLNPIDPFLNDIAELKQRPQLDLTDTDGDGVIDMFDQQMDSEPGCAVDTRGITLDSDGDGVIDCRDKEPFSPPGYTVDSDGIAQIEKLPYLTEGEINNLINNKLAGFRSGEWFLPMIHFDLDKYYVKPEFYGQLHNVATVMKMYPDMKIVAKGHTDVRKPSEYNNVLSYKRAKAAIEYLVSNYGLPRERFVLQYGGEENPLVSGLPDTHSIPKDTEIKQYLNRRVEFMVANPGDTEMGRPAGPDAGKNTPRSSRPGPKYSGNSNSGYK